MAIKIICGHSIFNENALCMSNKFNWKLETDFAPKPNDLYCRCSIGTILALVM